MSVCAHEIALGERKVSRVAEFLMHRSLFVLLPSEAHKKTDTELQKAVSLRIIYYHCGNTFHGSVCKTEGFKSLLDTWHLNSPTSFNA